MNNKKSKNVIPLIKKKESRAEISTEEVKKKSKSHTVKNTFECIPKANFESAKICTNKLCPPVQICAYFERLKLVKDFCDDSSDQCAEQLCQINEEFKRILANYDDSPIKNMPRIRANKIIKHLDESFNKNHNKVQRLPNFNSAPKVQKPKIQEVPEPQRVPEPKKVPQNEKNPEPENQKLFPGQLPGLGDFSCSSIKFSQEDQTVVEENYDFVPEIQESCHEILDFSCLHERKTRKQLLEDISFESEVHNIYNPNFDSESEDSLAIIEQEEENEESVKIPFLKKIQSVESKCEPLHPKKAKQRLGKVDSQRESFKSLSLFKKGPVMVHHRSLALKDLPKDDSKNSSMIQNRLAADYKSNKHHHDLHRNYSASNQNPQAYPIMKDIINPRHFICNDNHLDSVLNSLSMSNDGSIAKKKKKKTSKKNSSGTRKSFHKKNSFIHKMAQKMDAEPSEETAATMGITHRNTIDHNYFGILFNKGSTHPKSKPKSVKRIKGFCEIMNVKNMASPHKHLHLGKHKNAEGMHINSYNFMSEKCTPKGHRDCNTPHGDTIGYNFDSIPRLSMVDSAKELYKNFKSKDSFKLGVQSKKLYKDSFKNMTKGSSFINTILSGKKNSSVTQDMSVSSKPSRKSRKLKRSKSMHKKDRSLSKSKGSKKADSSVKLLLKPLGSNPLSPNRRNKRFKNKKKSLTKAECFSPFKSSGCLPSEAPMTTSSFKENYLHNDQAHFYTQQFPFTTQNPSKIKNPKNSTKPRLPSHPKLNLHKNSYVPFNYKSFVKGTKNKVGKNKRRRASSAKGGNR
ncbi:unnamed protein product [Moneuplotes crassus]|uniref:Uncharacterized protein n=1 Tax=Euplotes crassus TaxID=5936 RepID=A0AAD1XQI6_EUPCR|nr:unnamed protein product [Moneuplotes crassus]